MTEYLQGKRTTTITAQLKAHATFYNLPLSDLAAIKRIGNYTDFGIRQLVRKAKDVGVSIHTAYELEREFK